MDRYIGKIAVVTGASAGIGEAISKALAKKGIIVIGLARNIGKLQALADEISKDASSYAGSFQGLQCDLTKEKEIQDVFQHIKTNIGPVAILINNAGIVGNSIKTHEGDSCFELLEDMYGRVFDTNVKGLLFCTKEAMESMVKGDGVAHILNINSICSLPFFQAQNTLLYSASKRATRSLSAEIRTEVVKKKLLIKISDISPGSVLTAMTPGRLAGQDATCMISPEDVAKSCIHVLDTPVNVLISELTIMPIHLRLEQRLNNPA